MGVDDGGRFRLKVGRSEDALNCDESSLEGSGGCDYVPERQITQSSGGLPTTHRGIRVCC